MVSTAVKQNIGKNYRAKKMGLKEKFGHPDFILEQISECVKDGDFASITDFISSYVSNSPKYKSQDEFAEAIGTTRQTLHRMFAHENVSLNILFNALEKIHADQTAIAQPVDSKKFLEKAKGALKKHKHAMDKLKCPT
ncbi:MAG: hypothetical protein HYV97_02765 [Bdellovibrio sp.]|nr:hypothetical protein [Bdellovibrio sp.]